VLTRYALLTYFEWMYFSFTGNESLALGFRTVDTGVGGAVDASEARCSSVGASTSVSSPSLSALQSQESSCSSIFCCRLSSSNEFMNLFPSP